jgi:predicted PurR-regulated permease PerM
MEKKSKEKKIRSKKSIIIRLIFVVIYSIILCYLYILLANLGIEHFIIIIILVFLILIVLGPLITGISKDLYQRLFSGNRKSIEKSDYQSYKEQLKDTHQVAQKQPIGNQNITLDFKYRKSIIRKCHYCGIIIPNFVKKCPNCGKPILD